MMPCASMGRAIGATDELPTDTSGRDNASSLTYAQPMVCTSKDEAMQQVKRVLIPDETFDGEAIRTAFQVLLGVIEDDSSIKNCLLYVPGKANLQGTTLENILRSKPSKQLRDNHAVALGTASLTLETDKTLKSYTKADAALVVYADQKMMDKVDSNKSLKLVICVPHIPDAVDAWKRTWNPITPGSNQQEMDLISNKVVEAALVSITARINLGHQTIGPLDEDAVKDAFRILRAHRQTEDPANIRAWCIKHGWHAKAADEAVKHATKTFGLASGPSSYGKHWASDIYEKWVKAAKDHK